MAKTAAEGSNEPSADSGATENSENKNENAPKNGGVSLLEEEQVTAYDGNAYCDFDGGSINKLVDGKKILLCVFDKTGENLLSLVGQQGFSMEISNDTKEASQTKDSNGGWKVNLYGGKGWTMSVDGLKARDEESQLALIEAIVNDKYLCVKVVEDKSPNYAPLYGGLALVASYSEEAPQDDMTTYSAELTGTGALWVAALDEEGAAAATAAPSNR